MIKGCNFKSKIIHEHRPGCNLTPTETVCPGEDKCILFQTYRMLESSNSDNP